VKQFIITPFSQESSMAAKKAAKKKSTQSKKSNAARDKAVNKSAKEVAKAHKNLELALKKHKQVLTAMFFIS
jgi:hypothetical protein